MAADDPQPTVHVFGVRHHGPGSAWAVRRALADLQPDCILVEGPPDADPLIPWLANPGLVPPVALLVYRPDQPQRSTFYPYAVFSPEFQSLKFALENGIEARFMDLAQAHLLVSETRPRMPEEEAFRLVAQAGGYTTYEQWWNAVIEQRTGHHAMFQAILELMTAMRQVTEAGIQPGNEDPGALLSRQREAAMRQCIRRAAAGGYRRIAIVCGAWHAPALIAVFDQPAEVDEILLRDLPVTAVDASWVPWSYGRLIRGSGYGAGIASPGWYDHLWAQSEAGTPAEARSVHWLGKVAALLRDEGMDVSPAHVIDAVRLADSLAAIRGWSQPGLDEFNEAALTVMCNGEHAPMQLVNRRLIVGERMGLVPPDGPAVPLQRDLQREQQRLELLPQPEPETIILDLRRARDLDRSRLFHRLQLLDLPWAKSLDKKGEVGAVLGTFSEVWQLQWLPELTLRVIEAGMWGNTVRDAAVEYGRDFVDRSSELPALTHLIEHVLQADLPELIPAVLARIEALAAASHDVIHMLATLPRLAEILRYGDIRQSAPQIPMLRKVFDHLLTRACLSLPPYCLSLDQTAAVDLSERLAAVQIAIRLIGDPGGSERWQETLRRLADKPGIQPMVAGRATRLLHDTGIFQSHDVSLRLDRALSVEIVPGKTNPYPADWLDGFIRDSGLLLIHDQRLWSAVDEWLTHLAPEDFLVVLPLLRRTFVTFPNAVRRQLQERAGRPDMVAIAPGVMARNETRFDRDRAAAVIPTLVTLLGSSERSGQANTGMFVQGRG